MFSMALIYLWHRGGVYVLLFAERSPGVPIDIYVICMTHPIILRHYYDQGFGLIDWGFISFTETAALIYCMLWMRILSKNTTPKN